MKKLYLFLFVLLALSLTNFLFAAVNVTFNVNSSYVHGFTDSTHTLQVRGEIAGDQTLLQWNANSPALPNVGGDYWATTIAFPDSFVGRQVKWKAAGTIDIGGGPSDFWEEGSDRTFTLPATDTTLGMAYISNGWDPPYTPSDSVDIYFKINMASNALFDPETQFASMVGHFPAPDGADNMWNPDVYRCERLMSRGASPVPTDYWAFHLKLPQAYMDTVENILNDSGWPESARGMFMYRFAVDNNWANTENLMGKYWDGNENRTLFLKNTTGDTTINWQYWNNEAPTGGGVHTAVILWRLSTEALENIGMFDHGVGDSIQIRGPRGWGAPPEAIEMQYLPEISEWITAGEEFTNVENAQIDYKYFIDWDTSRVVSTSPNYITNILRIADDGWEEPAQTGGSNRTHAFQTEDQTVEGDWGFDRQFFNGVPANATFDHDITVSFSIDMTNATVLDSNAQTLFRPGIDTVWLTWDGELTGFNEGTHMWFRPDDDPPLDSRFLQLEDPDEDMIYTGDFTIHASPEKQAWHQLGYRVAYSTAMAGQYVRNGSDGAGFGRRYYQYIRPDEVKDEGGTWLTTIYPDTYVLPTMPWKDLDLIVETPPDLTQVASGIRNDDNVLRKFELEQNYPNPFNPATIITFYVAKASDVKISVYNVLGQKVVNLVNHKLQSGKYEILWNGKNGVGRQVASGLYFLKMEAGDFTKVRKMTLVR